MVINLDEIEENNRIIEDFINHKISVDNFCHLINQFWVKFRDRVPQKANQDFNKFLVNAVNNNFSLTEIDTELLKLYGSIENVRFSKFLDKVHSSCYVFNNSPRESWEIDEETLRSEICQFYSEYKIGKDQET